MQEEKGNRERQNDGTRRGGTERGGDKPLPPTRLGDRAIGQATSHYTLDPR